MRIAALGLLFAGSLMLSACAYNFGGVPRGIPGGYDKISVPVFRNKTAEVGVEPYFTSAFVEEIERARLGHVTDRTDAQVILDGEVTTVRYEQGVAVTRSADFRSLPRDAVMAKEYRVVVVVSMALKRISDESILWSGEFRGEQRYAAPLVTAPTLNTVDPLYNHSARHLTMKVLARAMMSEAHDRMTENF